VRWSLRSDAAVVAALPDGTEGEWEVIRERRAGSRGQRVGRTL